ncbi:zinc-binding dehydrogenase [Escherichia sp. E2593]|uniref:alcohol dehydrogenase catalytic domain-containing protein n=1 Tax=unclassified Escherichia TaxID=2608889 RepID=UPI001029F2A4|nr:MULTISPECIES: alcohol dehydrogenase catalytic domain-containing protein [unclassified Escherichia]RZN38208.1 L-idonate 5-dehydrogenase [Escherichia sp. E10V5]TGC09934.1 L-idonate 5-dehydrogenase [Escherichia sp. E2593]TGC14112.1 L-idonate 5-dehydrogenase [Escherichia sp. E4385]TLI77978.1 zinc-binding dehydrogenase [Escherichia sp. E2593]TLI96423.1 zinc-binding dehydrogenase [Escherichia sp. E4385]
MSYQEKTFTGLACYIKGEQDLVVEQKITSIEKGHVAIKINRGGICGSDIHYFYHGGVGDIKLQHPMLLGHEIIGTVIDSGESQTLMVGQKVAINPSLSCGHCNYCLEGKGNHCTDMLFFGSAMRTPHIHGGFADYLSVAPMRCVPYDCNCSDKVMVFAEPLAVALHAINQAGSLVGKNILVSGAGPIGCLIIAAAKACGALSVTAFDVSEKSCGLASTMGADEVINPVDEELLSPYLNNKGFFDISFEASGVESALQGVIHVTKPTGIIVQVGNSRGLPGVPVMQIVAKELTLKGTFRFCSEFNNAVRWLETGRIDPSPLISAELPALQIHEAIRLAADKTRSAKVQIIFN